MQTQNPYRAQAFGPHVAPAPAVQTDIPLMSSHFCRRQLPLYMSEQIACKSIIHGSPGTSMHRAIRPLPCRRALRIWRGDSYQALLTH
mmetsp:Transcript_17921/g.54010  ORF Transcript_17921/g.54010 Transcript_17921/m.54010 type:complete len:88 (-) Transcript_17921:639-902(-)